uniref:Uncharacterized protein n=1 Tax=Romanomermis culicivorax TaxID=13658 RepID=A0A915K4P2_ROMCU
MQICLRLPIAHHRFTCQLPDHKIGGNRVPNRRAKYWDYCTHFPVIPRTHVSPLNPSPSTEYFEKRTNIRSMAIDVKRQAVRFLSNFAIFRDI